MLDMAGFRHQFAGALELRTSWAQCAASLCIQTTSRDGRRRSKFARSLPRHSRSRDRQLLQRELNVAAFEPWFGRVAELKSQLECTRSRGDQCVPTRVFKCGCVLARFVACPIDDVALGMRRAVPAYADPPLCRVACQRFACRSWSLALASPAA